MANNFIQSCIKAVAYMQFSTFWCNLCSRTAYMQCSGSAQPVRAVQHQAHSCIAQSAQKNHVDLTNLRWKKKKEPEQKKLQFRCACCVRHPPPAHVCISTRGERTLLGRPARLLSNSFFIRVTYSELWRVTVLEIIFFFKSLIQRPFLKVCLHDATARQSAPVDSTVHAPRLVQCQKIATLQGLASSRRATDWLWVETDTDDCAIFLLLWTALTINDYKCWRKRNENDFIPSFSRSPIQTIFLITFTLFLTSVNAKEYRSKSRPNLL